MTKNNQIDKNKKIRCPFCSELIFSSAKKCRFCGEWLDGKETNKKEGFNKISINKLFFLWIFSLIIFFLIIYLVDFNFYNKSFTWIALLFFDILFGGIVFVVLISSIIKALIKERNFISSLKYLLATLLLFLSFSVILINLNKISFEKPELKTQNKQIKSPTPTKVQNEEKEVTQTSTVKNTSTNNTIDPSTPVHCNIHPDCGGGTTPLTYQECQNYTCCQTKDGWKFIPESECKIIHSEYDEKIEEIEKKEDRVPITLGGITIYCDEWAVDAIKEAHQTTIDNYNQKFNDCIKDEDKTFCEVSTTIYDVSYSNYVSLTDRHCN